MAPLQAELQIKIRTTNVLIQQVAYVVPSSPKTHSLVDKLLKEND